MRFSDPLIMVLLMAGTACAQSSAEVAETARGLFDAPVALRSLDLGLDATARSALTRANGHAHRWSDIRAWRVMKGDEFAGAVFVDEVKGKARPITYLAAFDTQGTIVGLEVLRYRESHGSEVRSSMFRDQFTGKSHADAIAIGKDIRNISGATISSRAVTRGAHALATLMTYLIREKRL